MVVRLRTAISSSTTRIVSVPGLGGISLIITPILVTWSWYRSKSMTPLPPKIHLTNAADYREGYANSVQIRVNLWDFFLLFGVVNQTAPDQVSIQNFQGVYVSPQQAKALLNVL